MADLRAVSANQRRFSGHSLTAQTSGEVRALLQTALEEPDLSSAVRAVDAVVQAYVREALKPEPSRFGLWPSVRQAADREVPAVLLERSLWQAHLRLVDGLLDGTVTADATTVGALTSFTVQCCTDVVRMYACPERLATARKAQDKRRILAQVLSDGDAAGGEAEQVLGLRSADHHWAAVLWSLPGSGLEVEDLIRFALTAASAVGGSRPLVAVDRSGEVWMWTRWTRPPKPEALALTCARLRFPDGLLGCSGPIAAGLSGFRRSLLAARAARQAFGPAPGSGWNHYTEVSPVSLLTGDQEQARWFVEETLGELGRDEAWCTTLRETLRLYLAYGRSRQQVAAAMYINRNTVAYRVQKAEQLLGRPIDEDTFDLRLALEIARVTNSGKDARSA